MTLTWTSAMRRSNRPNKPCEDYIALGDAACVVTDGVTQNADEYHEGMTTSDAAQAARLTAQTILARIDGADDPTAEMPGAVEEAIATVGDYVKAHPSPFPAATVFVSGAVRRGALHFAYIGDSVITLIRHGMRIRLSEPQTSHLRIFGSTKGMGITKRQLYDTITNNPDNPLSYGVIDGDMRAMRFLRAAQIELRAGDRVIFSSDGIDRYLTVAPIDALASLSAEAMLEASAVYDKPPYNPYADDKAVVILDVK